jgi:hypothetical protein
MDTLTFIDEDDYRTCVRDVNITRNGSFRSGAIQLFFVAGQKSIDFFCEHLEGKCSRDGNGWLFFCRLRGRSDQDEPRGSMKAPLIGFLAIFENRPRIPPVIYTPFKHGLIQTQGRSMSKIHLLVQLTAFRKQPIMHRPILALRPGTSCRHRCV